MDNLKTGKLIKELREKKGLSQKELAERVFVTRQAVSQWELGKSSPKTDTIYFLSKELDIDIESIFAGQLKLTKEEKAKTFIQVVKEHEKKLKKAVILFIIIIVLLACLFLGYYFINSYRSLKVYTVIYDQTDFYAEGIIVLSKKDSYLKLDLYHSDVKEMELYTKNNEEKEIITSSNDSSIYLQQSYGYDEYFNYNNIENNIKNLYLHVILKNGKEYDIQLENFKRYENSELLFKEKDDITDGGSNNIDNSVPSKIKKEFKYEDGTYYLEIKQKDTSIFISYLIDTQVFGVEENTGTSYKSWNFDINSNILVYEETDKNFKVINNFEVNISNSGEKEKKLVDYFIKNYKEVYLAEK